MPTSAVPYHCSTVGMPWPWNQLRRLGGSASAATSARFRLEMSAPVSSAFSTMIRFGTGDLSAVMPGPSPCGRTNVRIRGWLGRADQTTKVRGMFVHPGQVAEAVRRHPEVLRARLVITGEMAQDAMTLRCETRGAPEGLAARIADSLRDVTKLRGEVEMVAAGSLPNDGRVIEDARKYD